MPLTCASTPACLPHRQATEEYLEWYKQQKEQLSKEGGGGENGGAAPAAAADSEDNGALARVMELISQRPPVPAKADGGSAAVAADTFLSGLSAAGGERGDRGGSTADDRRRDREAEREAERERQRQKREEARRAEADERAYREAARAWEDHERYVCAGTWWWLIACGQAGRHLQRLCLGWDRPL